MIKFLLIALLRLYRFFLSPWLGHHCRFIPSCSVYAMKALETHGVVRGLGLTLGRLSRCHPWKMGGDDPVPPYGAPTTFILCRRFLRSSRQDGR